MWFPLFLALLRSSAFADCPSWGQCEEGRFWVRSQPNPVLGSVSERAEFDGFSRRVTPMVPGAKHSFLALFGGSMAYGQWLPDKATVGAGLSPQFPDTAIYNYAFPGSGPANMTVLMMDRNLRQEVPEVRGVGVYLYFPFHIHRVYPNSHFIGFNQGKSPYFEWKSGRLVRHGSMREGAPLWSWMLMQLGRLKRQWVFPTAGEKEKVLQCQLFQEMRRRFRHQFPQSEFVVATVYHHKPDYLIPHCLKPNGLPHVDLGSALRSQMNRGFFIPGDGHYTSVGAAAVASALSQSLRDQKFLPLSP